MTIQTALAATDLTLPLTSNYRFWRGVAVLIFVLIVMGFTPYFKKCIRRYLAYRRKHKASHVSEQTYQELYQHDENELDSLQLQIKEKNLRIEILERLSQRLEAEKNAYKSFAREIAFEVIPQITTPDQADRMMGTFKKFEGDSMNPIDLGRDLNDVIQEGRDRVVGDFFISDDKHKED
jgi:hypothetical protein